MWPKRKFLPFWSWRHNVFQFGSLLPNWKMRAGITKIRNKFWMDIFKRLQLNYVSDTCCHHCDEKEGGLASGRGAIRGFSSPWSHVCPVGRRNSLGSASGWGNSRVVFTRGWNWERWRDVKVFPLLVGQFLPICTMQNLLFRMVNIVTSDMLLWRKYDVNVTSSGQNDDATRFTKVVKIAGKHAKNVFRSLQLFDTIFRQESGSRCVVHAICGRKSRFIDFSTLTPTQTSVT
jgi:hypothetical protein